MGKKKKSEPIFEIPSSLEDILGHIYDSGLGLMKKRLVPEELKLSKSPKLDILREGLGKGKEIDKLDYLTTPKKDKDLIRYLSGYEDKIINNSIIEEKIINNSIIEEKIINNSIIEEKILELYNFYSTIGNIRSMTQKNIPQTNLFTRGVGMKFDDRITAENIAESVLPLVEYIRATRPDCVVACDRGARLIGLAVKMLYGELYGRLPTTDGTLRFRRISKSECRNKTKKHLKPLVKELLRVREKPKVLVIDDWVAGGMTQTLTKELFYELGRGKVDVKFGVLIGGNADVSGSMSRTSGFINFVEWHDNPYIIGVDYRNGNLKPVVLNSGEDIGYRKEMYKNIRKFVRDVKHGVQGKMESRFGKLISASG